LRSLMNRQHEQLSMYAALCYTVHLCSHFLVNTTYNGCRCFLLGLPKCVVLAALCDMLLLLWAVIAVVCLGLVCACLYIASCICIATDCLPTRYDLTSYLGLICGCMLPCTVKLYEYTVGRPTRFPTNVRIYDTNVRIYVHFLPNIR
jgi:hypothetical protein